jgi:hypothetical protein
MGGVNGVEMRLKKKHTKKTKKKTSWGWGRFWWWGISILRFFKIQIIFFLYLWQRHSYSGVSVSVRHTQPMQNYVYLRHKNNEERAKTRKKTKHNVDTK